MHTGEKGYTVIKREGWTRRLFESIDDTDVDGFAAFLADDVSFTFGNAPSVKGKAAVRDVVGGFFGSIKGLRHDLERVWDEEDTVICHGKVTYTRHDSSTLSVPFANILGVRGDLITEYLIFVDTSEL
jgi:ketosteroid isomerase-like protein